MYATKLKDILEKAIISGIITCKEIHSLRCPAVGYVLVHGRCQKESDPKFDEICFIGDNRNCRHRLDILYSDRSAPTTLIVKYRIRSKIKEGYIDDENEQLCKVLEKINS